MVTLIKEIGTDGLFALLRVLEGEAPRAGRRPSTEHCRDDDLAVAVAQTDVKGDRSQAAAPAGRPRPLRARGRPQRRGHRRAGRQVPHLDQRQRRRDHRLADPGHGRRRRRLRRRLRRARPTPRACRCTSRRYARAATATTWASRSRRRHKMLETLTVFDDVFVPWERVFVCRRARAGRAAGADLRRVPPLHRGVLQAAAASTLLVGAAAAIAEMNGVIEGRPHPRQADPARHLRRDGAGPDRDGRPAGPHRRATASPTRTR